METITIKSVADAVERAHGWCTYHDGTNETYGPWDVANLAGPLTSRKYNRARAWNTEIAIALAAETFDVDLSRHEIVDTGPWRDTVRAIHAAIVAEIAEESEYQREIL